LTDYRPEEIEYAIEWAIKNIRDIQSFALIPHVIDQALKVKNEKEQEEEARKRANQEAKKQAEQEERETELQRKIDEIRNKLSREELRKIHQQAEEIINQSADKNKKFGSDTLIRLKENEIVRQKYLK